MINPRRYYERIKNAEVKDFLTVDGLERKVNVYYVMLCWEDKHLL